MNRIDASLSFYIQKYPSLLLVSPIKQRELQDLSKAPRQPVSKPAASLEEVESVPDTVRNNLTIILKFLSGLLANSSNKSIFNSVEDVVDLLAAADDNIAYTSLEVLHSLATPPSLHKQQVPEIQQHSTALHISKSASHKRLTALARGWGTRGSGLGLYTCAVSDDSSFGQGSLPQEAGELNFNFFETRTREEKTEETDDLVLVDINLSARNFVVDPKGVETTTRMSEESDDSTGSKQKRRRVALTGKGEKNIRSTADLFFYCVQQAGGSERVPSERLFQLLADIRLTRSFYRQATRVAAIERRLRALVTILHAHSSQEIMAGYFQAQPELCVELVDLLRPTVSSGAVSATATSTSLTSEHHPAQNQDSIAALANSPLVPYQVRELALQSLTALAARRDGSSGGLAGFARHSNILSELGVGKGQYLGLLPTLIRYSLASLGSLISTTTMTMPSITKNESRIEGETAEDNLCIDIGLAFIEATSAPALPRFQQLEKALLFIDSVLTLTSAIISTPSGTSSLTECGLIPALLNTVSIHCDESITKIMPESSSASEMLRIQSLLRFIIAQAVQILEGAIVTHNNALSAFHNLKGVEVLTNRLSKEVLSVRDNKIKSESKHECSIEAEHKMDIDLTSSIPEVEPRSSQRVLLFGIVTCLTVVFHQESTSSSISTPSGTVELQKPELTEALIEILDNVNVYGGHLVSLISTLLSDVMNGDPHVVRYVYESSLAHSFLKMLDFEPSAEPIPPPVPELIMSIPAILAALALTEAGATKIKERNPFPGLLKIFYHPKYAMPRSRCLLNEMTSIVGTGLDEIMRHVPSLSKLICKAISEAMMEVVSYGNLVSKNECDLPTTGQDAVRVPIDVDHDRSCLIQYTLNFGQILEQILHNEDHCEPFVESGGLDAILKMYPHLMPSGERFLAHVSCLSCPSLSTISHSTTEETLTLAFKCISMRCNTLKLLRKTVDALKQSVDLLKVAQLEMKSNFPTDNYNIKDDFDAVHILDGLPRMPLYNITDPFFIPKKAILAKYLRAAVIVQWQTGLLSTAIQASCQRCAESGSPWSRTEREWKKELCSIEFQDLFNCVSTFFQSATFEACRIRTEDGFEERELKRQQGNGQDQVRYKLRVVCPEGAVVRDGIEIDVHASVGSMEMGEIVESYDRCVNSSGVLRYRTQRGWLSEQTRGHGREPIAEVLALWKSKVNDKGLQTERDVKGRIEDGIPDLRSSGANVLARMQTIYVELYSSLLRLAFQSLPSLSARHISYQQGGVGWHVSTLMKILSSGITKGFSRPQTVAAIIKRSGNESKSNKFGVALYLGSMLSHLRACLFEEKRDKYTVNLLLLISLATDHMNNKSEESYNKTKTPTRFFDAIQFILELALDDFESKTTKSIKQDTIQKIPRQRLDRAIASCLPSTCSLLRSLLSAPSILSSQTVALLGKMTEMDVSLLVGLTNQDEKYSTDSDKAKLFSIEQFSQTLICELSDTLIEPWSDDRIENAPVHIIHPFSTLVSETMVALEDLRKSPPSALTPNDNTRDNSSSNVPFRSMLEDFRAAANGINTNDDFEPSEEAISRLVEMGFSRDHAWDAIDRTRSNALEIAMEYALSNTPASTESIERRRTESERRRRQHQEQANNSGNSGTSEAEGISQPDSRLNPSDGNVSTETMNIDNASSKESSKQDTKSKTQADQLHEKSIEMVSSRVVSWKLKSSSVACRILSTQRKGDTEREVLTTVVSSFLLNLCQRYPDDSDKIVGEIFNRLKDQISEKKNGDTKLWNVISGNESSFASLCHCSMHVIRSLPKKRILFLKAGLVGSIISIVTNYLKDSGSNVSKTGEERCSMWLSSTLLMLDVMARPLIAFPSKNDSNNSENSNYSQDFYEVKGEHKKQTLYLSELAYQLFSALNKSEKAKDTCDSNDKKTLQSSIQSGSGGDESLSCSNKNNESESSSAKIEMIFQSVPAYFPLIPSQTFEACADICLTIIGDRSVSTQQPEVTHAALLLLLRLLRNPKMSTYCMKAGAGPKILNLKKSSRFNGHSGLATFIFRRLLEDENMLRSSMETEIRNSILKLDSKKRSPPVLGEKETISVPRKSFLKAVTPILCRDPASFLKALAVTTAFEKSNSDPDQKNGRVVLLTSTQRSKNLEIISEILSLKQCSSQTGRTSSSRKSSGKQKRLSTGSRGRSKTPIRSSKRQTLKKCKKEKREGLKETNEEDLSKNLGHHTSPLSQQITWLLLNQIIQTDLPTACDKTDSSTDNFDFGYETSFLWISNILEILADLVLSIPTCATAIHKFKPPKKYRESSFTHFNNAISCCPSPPRTFVSFLLHGLLSQDCWNMKTTKNSGDLKTGSDVKVDTEKKLKKNAFIRTKIVRSTARLLVSLVARPGEGRRRVIVELIFALSGGLVQKQNITGPSLTKLQLHPHPSAVHILQRWGELCIGFAAPKSNGSNYDSNGVLSYDVIKLMLENGMAHALLVAIQMVPLHHPMASVAGGSLILPFEILTRPSVTDSVKTILEKETRTREEKEKLPKSIKQNNSLDRKSDVNHRQDSFVADDHMLEDAFTAEVSRGRGSSLDHQMADREEDASGMDIDSDIDEVLSDDDDGDDDEMSSESESSNSSNDDDSDVDDDIDDDSESADSSNNDSDNDDDSMIDGGEESDDADTMGEFEEDAFLDSRSSPLVGEDSTELFEAADDSEHIEEGWTPVESSGLGGIVFGRRGIGHAAGLSSGRSNRGFIDAAEAMIGTLLRTGEIRSDALSEIENTLGIRIVGGRDPRSSTSRSMNSSTFGNLFSRQQSQTETNSRSPGLIGAFPQIIQRRQPDLGYSTIGRASRWSEINPTEYLFGGPCITAGSRYYDLISPVTEAGDESDSILSNTSGLSDTQLFPGGVATATHTRTHHCVHPLFANVDLPPINALVLDLESNVTNEHRNRQSNVRRLGEWTSPNFNSGGFFVSNSSGTVVGSNRMTNNGSQAPLSGNSGSFGWTDYDGSAIDSEFSSAFENAIGETESLLTVAASPASDTERQTPVSDTAVNNGTRNGEPRSGGTSSDAIENEGGTTLRHEEEAIEMNNESSTVNESNENSGREQDGDGVASSLAAGLRLSIPSNEPSSNNDQSSIENRLSISSNHNQITSNVSATNRGDENSIPMETASQQPESAVGLEERPSDTGACDNQVSETRIEVPNENGLVCPAGMDSEVFNVLPLEVRLITFPLCSNNHKFSFVVDYFICKLSNPNF